ncbi:MAG TPA: branched-chain amino acid ABC transporter substrate-binding protein, partial [Acidimicrobiia bacterium]|nr:branched-chain amino acid ABC transporter substrate-binding protein [Acidimicrobiia bacterium]
MTACSRDKETTESSDAESATTASEGQSSNNAQGLDAGAFGDLGVICQPGDGATASSSTSDPGVTADSVQISTFSDPGFSGRLGLNQELFDTAEAFTKWCNEHGGING